MAVVAAWKIPREIKLSQLEFLRYIGIALKKTEKPESRQTIFLGPRAPITTDNRFSGMIILFQN